MDNYLPEEYERIIQNLQPIIDEHELDKITIAGLVRGSIEIEQQPIQAASRIWTTKNGVTYTIKPSNIKVSLGFALGNAFRLKTLFSQKDIWLVFAIIHMLVDLFTDAVDLVDETSALVLLAVYRMQNGNFEKIFDYAQRIKPEESHIEINEKTCYRALENLQELRCIKLLESGEYILIESVDSSLYA